MMCEEETLIPDAIPESSIQLLNFFVEDTAHN